MINKTKLNLIKQHIKSININCETIEQEKVFNLLKNDLLSKVDSFSNWKKKDFEREFKNLNKYFKLLNELLSTDRKFIPLNYRETYKTDNLVYGFHVRLTKEVESLFKEFREKTGITSSELMNNILYNFCLRHERYL